MAKRKNAQDHCPTCHRFVRYGVLACRNCVQRKELGRMFDKVLRGMDALIDHPAWGPSGAVGKER